MDTDECNHGKLLMSSLGPPQSIHSTSNLTSSSTSSHTLKLWVFEKPWLKVWGREQSRKTPKLNVRPPQAWAYFMETHICTHTFGNMSIHTHHAEKQNITSTPKKMSLFVLQWKRHQRYASLLCFLLVSMWKGVDNFKIRISKIKKRQKNLKIIWKHVSAPYHALTSSHHLRHSPSDYGACMQLHLWNVGWTWVF